uniref:Uncharacterized protein n=1 Tax=Rhizophora mucronata TaxID=61149 RepID=A0A2P2QFZ7_RHIMU
MNKTKGLLYCFSSHKVPHSKQVSVVGRDAYKEDTRPEVNSRANRRSIKQKNFVSLTQILIKMGQHHHCHSQTSNPNYETQ